MNKPDQQAIATTTVWVVVGLNVALTLLDVWRQAFALAAYESVIVAVFTTWMAIRPKVHAWLDARLAEAVANRQTSETILAEVQRSVQAGELRVGGTVMDRSARPH